MIIVRFADDFIVGFEHQGDAKQFLRDLRERFAKFSLELHPDKTRLIEFGRFAADRRAARGLGQAGDVRLSGLHAHLREDPGRAVLAAAHHDLEADAGEAERGQGPAQATPARANPRARTVAGQRGTGPSAYYAVPGNVRAVTILPDTGDQALVAALRSRSQRHRLNWDRMNRLATRWLPPARILHPYPDIRFDARTRGRSPVR